MPCLLLALHRCLLQVLRVDLLCNTPPLHLVHVAYVFDADALPLTSLLPRPDHLDPVGRFVTALDDDSTTRTVCLVQYHSFSRASPPPFLL